MKIYAEITKMTFIFLLTLVAMGVAYVGPWYLSVFLLLPIALSGWFWPETSTPLAYVVGAILGTILSAFAFSVPITSPDGFPFAFLWLPLVWGPAGVLVKRLELIAVELGKRQKLRKYKLPKVKK